MNAELVTLCNNLIAALASGGAQGLAIVALVWIALKLCRGANAATRHAAWFATLIMVALLPAAIFFMPREAALDETPLIQTAANPIDDPLNSRRRGNESLTDLAPTMEVTDSAAKRDRPLQFAETAVAGTDGSSAAPSSPIGWDRENIITRSSTEPELQFPTAPSGPLSLWERAGVRAPSEAFRVTAPNFLAITLIACWALLASTRLSLIGCQLVQLYRLKRRAHGATQRVADSFARICSEMGVSRRATLLISEDAVAPMAVGFFRPAVMLPKTICAETTTPQIERLFRHELAHVARCDDWANLFQQVVSAVFFFHPAILFVSRRLTNEREIACDDHALAGGGAPRDYALLLTEFASRMKGRDFTAAPAAWSSNSQLKERIGMILDVKRNASPRVSRAGAGAVTAATLCLAIGALLASPRLVLAAAEDDKDKDNVEATVDVTVETTTDGTIEFASADTAPQITTTTITSGPKEKREKRVIITSAAPAVEPVPALAPLKALQPAQPGQPPRVNRPNVVVAMTPDHGPDHRPGPAPRPHPRPHVDRGGDDDHLERRLERVERMLEQLVGKEKGQKGSDQGWNPNFQHKFQWQGQPPHGDHFGPEFHEKLRTEIERAHRDADRAHKEAGKALKDVDVAAIHKKAMEAAQGAQLHAEKAQVDGMRQSMKARRHALEAQRRALDKEIESIERQMEREEERRNADKEKRDAEKERAKEQKEKAKRDADNEKQNSNRNSNSSSSSNSDNSSSNKNSDEKKLSDEDKPQPK